MLDRTVEERHSKPFRLNLDDGKSLISHQWLDGSAVALWRTNPKSRFSIDADKLLFNKKKVSFIVREWELTSHKSGRLRHVKKNCRFRNSNDDGNQLDKKKINISVSRPR